MPDSTRECEPQTGTPAVRLANLTVITGCMFAGKTTRLIQTLAEAQAAGAPILACKHALDTRYAAAALATHDGRRWRATSVASAAEIISLAHAARVVGIDEGHFFGNTLVGVCRSLVEAEKRVIVATLELDAWGQPFESIVELLAVARQVERREATCARCGRPARYSQRLSPVRPADSMVAGTGDFEPRCERCFVPLSAEIPRR